MTGGTLIVKSGITYGMTKVAHDGFDLQDLDVKALIAKASTIDAIIVSYLRGRGGIDFDAGRDVMDDEQVKDCYLVKTYEDAIEDCLDFGDVLNDMEDWLNDQIEEQELDDDHPWMQLGCSYSDYVLEIDLDQQVALLNGEKVW